MSQKKIKNNWGGKRENAGSGGARKGAGRPVKGTRVEIGQKFIAREVFGDGVMTQFEDAEISYVSRIEIHIKLDGRTIKLRRS